MPVIVVGGGAGLCSDALDGASRVIRPPHADVANAVGAAIPQVAFQAIYCSNMLLPVLHDLVQQPATTAIMILDS